ncbi:MAG: hypothetical protein A6D92_09710 [Symbiobacterium thermophilum]|uniref:Uncharacterized protein n=1 Tax=Symbiobacterium thermophilum TaxID=2734 RepID=A0A1Y2T3V3_SYMTR|nr:hypothetical protein [Symbiobacterium thermophilum]OTA41131.1 MAG: hypothetical protein A6D92_09710 [Symbiobacterium thermophilum]
MTQKASESAVQDRDRALLYVASWFAGLSMRERITAALAIADRFMAQGNAVLAAKWADWALEMERELEESNGNGPEEAQAE